LGRNFDKIINSSNSQKNIVDYPIQQTQYWNSQDAFYQNPSSKPTSITSGAVDIEQYKNIILPTRNQQILLPQ